MRYRELKYTGSVPDGVKRNTDGVYKNQKDITKILKSKKLFWFINSEVENVIFEIKKDTIIWYDGYYQFGDWEYGIFKNGSFHGKFISGIWESGNFEGEWIDGIKL